MAFSKGYNSLSNLLVCVLLHFTSNKVWLPFFIRFLCGIKRTLFISVLRSFTLSSLVRLFTSFSLSGKLRRYSKRAAAAGAAAVVFVFIGSWLRYIHELRCAREWKIILFSRSYCNVRTLQQIHVYTSHTGMLGSVAREMCQSTCQNETLIQIQGFSNLGYFQKTHHVNLL